MKLDCVVSACNTHPLYVGFIPIFIRAWRALYPSVDIKIVFISDHIPDNLKPYAEHIILFSPIAGVSTAFTSQYIRLLYPCILNYKNGIMITDIDILPMNSTYYSKNIEQFDDSKFVYLRDACFEYNEIAMCYNVALNRTWAEIFDIHTINDIRTRLANVFSEIQFTEGHGNTGWNTDQTSLFHRVMEWNKNTNNFEYIRDKASGFKRLDRIHIQTMGINEYICNLISDGFFSDYHCLRPYEEYKMANDAIVDLLNMK
jgi:hypothetical protein